MPNKFIVTLKENPDDTFTATHECKAVDSDDAETQALASYPNYDVINITDMGRIFYKTVVSYEILSEEPFTPMSLSDIEYECTDGHMSGCFLDTVQVELTSKEMAECLIVQGSDTEFFNLDADGNVIDD